jgi:hypothetical protein
MEKMSSETTTPPTSRRGLSTIALPDLVTLQIEVDGDIGTLTLNRPDSLNAMSPEMIGELVEAFSWLADQAPLRALIVTGAERAFSAGGDVNWFKEGVESDEIDLPSNVRRGAEVLHQAIIDLRRIPYPVIAAINGPAAVGSVVRRPMFIRRVVPRIDEPNRDQALLPGLFQNAVAQRRFEHRRKQSDDGEVEHGNFSLTPMRD